MGFSRQEYWSGLPFLSPGDLPNPGIEPGPSEFLADSSLSEATGKPNLVWTPENVHFHFKDLSFQVRIVGVNQEYHIKDQINTTLQKVLITEDVQKVSD